MDTKTDFFDLAQAATAGAGGQVERAAAAGAQGLDDRVAVLRPCLQDGQQQRIEVGSSGRIGSIRSSFRGASLM